MITLTHKIYIAYATVLCTRQAFNGCRAAAMLLLAAEGCHAVQAFVQKLAVCLLDVDKDPSSPMEDQMNNWTAEATCFVSFFILDCLSESLSQHELYIPQLMSCPLLARCHQKQCWSGKLPVCMVNPPLQKQDIALHSSCTSHTAGGSVFCTLCSQCNAG